jgi:hypothetical protein
MTAVVTPPSSSTTTVPVNPSRPSSARTTCRTESRRRALSPHRGRHSLPGPDVRLRPVPRRDARGRAAGGDGRQRDPGGLPPVHPRARRERRGGAASTSLPRHGSAPTGHVFLRAATLCGPLPRSLPGDRSRLPSPRTPMCSTPDGRIAPSRKRTSKRCVCARSSAESSSTDAALAPVFQTRPGPSPPPRQRCGHGGRRRRPRDGFPHPAPPRPGARRCGRTSSRASATPTSVAALPAARSGRSGSSARCSWPRSRRVLGKDNGATSSSRGPGRRRLLGRDDQLASNDDFHA